MSLKDIQMCRREPFLTHTTAHITMLIGHAISCRSYVCCTLVTFFLQVRSFSQLRRELSKNKLFFLDSSISEDSSSSGNSRRLIDRPVMKDARVRSGSVPPAEKMDKMSDLPKSKFQLESLYRNEVQNGTLISSLFVRMIRRSNELLSQIKTQGVLLLARIREF